MKMIGVTGGIGSGKSSVSRILQELGARVIDADVIAKQVVNKGEKALEELTVSFGKNILDENGELDRKKLGQIVFENPEELEVLNRITHKYVVERMSKMIEAYKADIPNNIIVMDVPIPVKHGFLDRVDKVWVVMADREVRIQRVMKRSGFSREEIQNRIDSQMKDHEYLEIADEVLWNNGTFEELKGMVEKLFFKLCQGDDNIE